MDWNGIAVVIGALATAIVLVGNFVISIKTHINTNSRLDEALKEIQALKGPNGNTKVGALSDAATVSTKTLESKTWSF